MSGNWAMAEVRAAFFIPVWFAMQFFNGALALAAAQRTQEVIGIAWWAHVGGFLVGVMVAATHRASERAHDATSSGSRLRAAIRSSRAVIKPRMQVPQNGILARR